MFVLLARSAAEKEEGMKLIGKPVSVPPPEGPRSLTFPGIPYLHRGVNAHYDGT